MTLKIQEQSTQAVIASGELGQAAMIFEGYWYFDPNAVNMEHLKVTERIYTCSYKGTCFWIDFESPEGTVRNVGWVYRNPMDGFEFIKDKIGFYPRNTPLTVALQEEPS